MPDSYFICNILSYSSIGIVYYSYDYTCWLHIHVDTSFMLYRPCRLFFLSDISIFSGNHIAWVIVVVPYCYYYCYLLLVILILKHFWMQKFIMLLSYVFRCTYYTYADFGEFFLFLITLFAARPTGDIWYCIFVL